MTEGSLAIGGRSRFRRDAMPRKAEDMIDQTYTGSWDEGTQLEKDTGATSAQAGSEYAHDREKAAGFFDEDVAGGGGYTKGQEEGIIREGELYGSLTPQDAYERQFLTPEEKGEMRPDVERYEEYFKPEEMMTTQQEHQDQRIAADTTMGEQYSEAIGSDLYASEGYFGAMDEAVGGAEERIDKFGDPTRLRADEAALDEIRMDDAEQERMVAGASKTVGNLMRAKGQQVSRAGRAAGLSAAGMGAQGMRYARDTAAEAADAALQAKIGSGAARATRAGYAESLRQGGEESAGLLGTKQAFEMGRLKRDVAQSAEETRLGATQDVSDRRIGQTEYQHGARTKTAKDIMEGKSDQQQFNAELGTEIVQAQERDKAEAASAIALERTGTEKDQSTQKFEEKSYVGEQASARSETVAKEELEDTRTAKKWFGEQPEKSSSRQLESKGQEIDVYGTKGQIGVGAARAKTEKDKAPRTWERVVGAGTDFLDAVIPG